MRLLFAGTPEAAVPTLNTILAGDHDVVAVLTRPDAPTGRGRRLRPSPVRSAAEEAGIPVLTPTTLRDAGIQQQLRELDLDVAVVVAYGLIVPAAALAIPRHGWLNLHFSLLPELRGAAPAQRAILEGRRHTGMSVFRLATGMDTGDLLRTATTPIGATETAGELLERLAEEGAPLVDSALTDLASGEATFTPQDDTAATTAPKLTVEEALLRPDRPREEVAAHIRGMSPHPGAWALFRGERMKLLGVEDPARVTPPDGLELAPGRLHATKHELWLGTATSPLALSMLAPSGRRPMRAADWARGAGLSGDETLSAPQEAS